MHERALPMLNRRVRFTWTSHPADYGTVIDDEDLDIGYVRVEMDEVLQNNPAIYRFHVNHLEVIR